MGWQKLQLDPRARTVTLLAPKMRLDLGGIAKGYAADQALQVLQGRGLDRALVAASGDIAIGNAPPGQRGWKIAIAAMDSPTNDPACTLLLEPHSVYRALEMGETLSSIVQLIEGHGTKALPTAVLDSLKTWSSKRERLSVYPAGAIFESLGFMPEASRP